MRCELLRVPIAILCILDAAGCRLVASPEAVVAPGMTAVAASPAAEKWLESATLVCLPPAPQVVAAAAAPDAVAQAAYAPSDSATSAAAMADAAPQAIPVLAIRYPHPDGRRDVARAELIVADLAAEAEADASWRPRLGRALAGALPGVAWGPGIRRAVGLDVPVAEIQDIVVAAQQASPADGSVAAPASTALVRLEVNGQPAPIATASPAVLERLAQRTMREGRLISYRGRASELLAATGR